MDKEKLVRDLVNTFDDRDSLHKAYKERMKNIIEYAIYDFMHFLMKINENEIEKSSMKEWIDDWVEKNFKPE